MSEGRTCRMCGRAFPPEVVICIDCGVDLRTGRILETTIGVEEEEEPVRAPDPAAQLLPPWMLAVGRICPGFFSPFTLVMAVVAFVAAIAIGLLGLFVLSLGALMAAISIGAVAFLSYAQSLAFLLGGDVRLLQNVLADLDGPRWGVFVLLTFGPLLVGFMIAVWVAKVAAG